MGWLTQKRVGDMARSSNTLLALALAAIVLVIAAWFTFELTFLELLDRRSVRVSDPVGQWWGLGRT